MSGPRSVRLRVAGLTLALSAPPGAPLPRLQGAARRFAVSRGGDIRLRLASTGLPEWREADLLFDSGQVWRLYRRPAGLLYTFSIPRRRPPVYKAIEIDRGLTEGVLHFPSLEAGPDPTTALDFPLDELLFQHRLAREGGVELHACGLLCAAGVALFCGQSGAGKTTTARLWRRGRPGGAVLSDDRIVVRERRGHLLAFGTPWHGEAGYADPGSGPVAGVFFLRHSRRPGLRRLTPGEAAARLFSRTFPPLWDPAAVEAVLATCCRLAGAVPCYDFGFLPDRSAVRMARAALAG